MWPADVHAELGRVLREHGYAEHELGRLLGASADRAVDPDYVPIAVRRVRAEEGPLATLAELFLLGRAVDGDRARAALAPLDHARLAEAGLLSVDVNGVRATLGVLPYQGLLFAHDTPAGGPGGDQNATAPVRGAESTAGLGVASPAGAVEANDASPPGAGEATDPADEITAPVPAARMLAAVTVRRRAARALDLGSGGGVQGLLLARHADHVVLSDVSPRARTMAGLNATLNGIDNVELRTGDWFEPVAGERFDLVAANLPYVVSPDLKYVYRDNPLERDELSRWVVERVGGYLTDGGIAHVLCSWVHGRDEEWAPAPLAWAAASGCDALVLHYASHEPLEYATSWNRPLQRTDPAEFEATVDRWLAYYAEAGIERIATGVVILRRRGNRRAWHRPVEVPEAPTGLGGAHVERLLAAQDELGRLPGPEALLQERLRPVAGQRLDQAMLYRDGAYLPDAALMRRDPGIGVVARVDPRVMPVIVGCDGRRTLGELIDRATERSSGKERVELATLCFATVRTAYELGLLERAGGGP
jgi:methylase of polypeptide subunit release factors